MWHVQSRESASVCPDRVHRMFSRHLSKHFPNGYFGHSWRQSHSLSHICSSVEKHYWASVSSESLKRPIAVCFICDCGGCYLKIGAMSHFWYPLDSSQLWAYRLLRKTCWLIAYLEVFSGSLGCVGCISVYGSMNSPESLARFISSNFENSSVFHTVPLPCRSGAATVCSILVWHSV